MRICELTINERSVELILLAYGSQLHYHKHNTPPRNSDDVQLFFYEYGDRIRDKLRYLWSDRGTLESARYQQLDDYFSTLYRDVTVDSDDEALLDTHITRVLQARRDDRKLGFITRAEETVGSKNVDMLYCEAML